MYNNLFRPLLFLTTVLYCNRHFSPCSSALFKWNFLAANPRCAGVCPGLPWVLGTVPTLATIYHFRGLPHYKRAGYPPDTTRDSTSSSLQLRSLYLVTLSIWNSLIVIARKLLIFPRSRTRTAQLNSAYRGENQPECIRQLPLVSAKDLPKASLISNQRPQRDNVSLSTRWF